MWRGGPSRFLATRTPAIVRRRRALRVRRSSPSNTLRSMGEHRPTNPPPKRPPLPTLPMLPTLPLPTA